MRVQFETEAVIDGGHNFGRVDRPFHGIAANLIALAYDTPAFNTTTREIHCPALRPMITSSRGINFRRSSKFGEAGN